MHGLKDEWWSYSTVSSVTARSVFQNGASNVRNVNDITTTWAYNKINTQMKMNYGNKQSCSSVIRTRTPWYWRGILYEWNGDIAMGDTSCRSLLCPFCSSHLTCSQHSPCIVSPHVHPFYYHLPVYSVPCIPTPWWTPITGHQSLGWSVSQTVSQTLSSSIAHAFGHLIVHVVIYSIFN